MASNRSVTLGLTFAAVMTVAIFGVSVVNRQRVTAPITKPILRATDPQLGPDSALVTVVEFGDFECSFCKQQAQVLADVLPSYGNRVRLIWKDFPLSLHRQARGAALAARCAQAQGQFWPFAAQLSQATDLSPDRSVAIATDLGLDIDIFRLCLVDTAPLSLIDQSASEAQALQILQLPTLFINDQRFEGLLDAPSLRQLIDVALAKS